MLKMLSSLRMPENKLLLAATSYCFSERGNAHRVGIARIKRSKYVRQYFVTLLQPDGSTIPIRAPEPVDLIQVPLNLDALTDQERRKLAMKRHKTRKIVKTQDPVKFNADEYVELWKKSNSKKAK